MTSSQLYVLIRRTLRQSACVSTAYLRLATTDKDEVVPRQRLDAFATAGRSCDSTLIGYWTMTAPPSGAGNVSPATWARRHCMTSQSARSL